MIIPFGNLEGYNAIKEIAGTKRGKVIKNLGKYLKNFSMNIIQEQKVIKIEDAYTIWVYACIFDDIGNNNDYSQFCSLNIIEDTSYADIYKKARENIRTEFNNIKMMSKKHTYSMPDILCILSLMLCIIKDNANSELMKRIEHNNLKEKFEESLRYLIRNIGKYVINIRQTYPEEFGDYI